jgi:polysaccharide export outer membrane protein
VKGPAVALAWAWLAGTGAAQSPSPAASPEAAALPGYRVGSGDVLEIVVFGNEVLSRSPTVQSDGTVSLPLLGEVPVAGLSVTEVQRKVTTLLARDYLVNPQVEVKVKDYQSQFVTVLGEVNAPGRKPLRGRTRLVDALVEAGGFTPRASGDVRIARGEGGFEGGASTLELHLEGGALGPKDRVNLEVLLQHGDVVTASAKQYVTVEGEVARPGRYVLEGSLTASGAISVAGGLTRFGSHKAQVRRSGAGGGPARILEVDLKAVRRGRKPDLPLEPGDVVFVPRRFF